MDIHHYDPVTGVYLGASAAVADPVEWDRARRALIAERLSEAHAAFAAALADDVPMAQADTALTASIQAAEAEAAALAAPAWLIPACATTDAPPDVAAGERARFTEDGWIVEPVPEEPEPEPEPAREPTEAELAAAVRARRDAEIAALRWLIDRHRDEVALGRSTTLTVEDYLLVLQHVQDLRDVPEQDSFPQTIDWPALDPALLATGD